MMKHRDFALRARDRTELEGILRDGNIPQKIVKRAKIVLMTADGAGVMTIMRAVGVSKTTVWRWQDYFVEAGVAGLVKGRSKPPGKKPIADALKLKIVEKTVKQRPVNATHWSMRMMAKEMGISHTSVQRIWNAHGLKPHLVRTFKASNDPDFARRWRTSSASTLIRPIKRWCLPSTRRARSKPWIARSRACLSRKAVPAP